MAAIIPDEKCFVLVRREMRDKTDQSDILWPLL